MIKKILITVALSLTAILTPTYFVAADSYTVPMQILENGTNKTSYAAAYFAGSATVAQSSPAASSEAATSHQPSATSVTVSSESSKITSSSAETSASSTSSSVASTSSSAKKKAPTTKKEVPSKSVTRETPLPIAAIIGGGLVIGIASAVALNLLKKK
ncbi:hypothetical protein [Weissella confusa]|uniref:hypothetical protein n=1 Tax=Weissella confusa TaxID=1583 RepID=UPI0018F15ECF|nr:hypothetical protein [Weissella confusa]MBJ7649031.1 hypothetical protein [Weissella confusa]MBJ7660819.1 hypothetical protein [Weissella confusa]